MTAAADLSTRLVIEAPVEAADGAGGVTRSFADAGRVWARLTPLTMDDRVVADCILGVLTHRATVRARSGLTTAHRLKLGPRRFRIRALGEVEAGRFLELLLEEERG
ncbi:MAG: phage head closure protein [Blastochloris sp.]|nr:phage head closure protein [Blastochloris sp.]